MTIEKAKEIIQKSRGCSGTLLTKCFGTKCEDCEFYYSINEDEELRHWIEDVTSSAIEYLENSRHFNDNDMELFKMIIGKGVQET